MNRRSNQILIGVGIILFLLIIVPAGKFVLDFYTESQITATVTDKERITEAKSSYYLVYTDKEVFTIQDSWVKWRWNSSDVYGDLEIGKTYNLTVFGWRSGFLSLYRNILTYEKI